MITAHKSLPQSRVSLTVTASAAQFNEAFEKEFENLAKDVQITGFRKGKAPKAQVIKQLSRMRIEAGALDRVISQVYFESMQENNLVPTAPPQIEVTEFTAPGEDTPADQAVLTFTAEADVIPKVEVEGYKKIKIKLEKKTEIEPMEKERVLEYLRKQQAVIKETEDEATLENGMWVDLAYEGSVDGVKRSDMANKNHPMVLGEGQLIPGFEEQLIGMKAGDIKTIQVTFPKEYHSKELAGKKAEFVVTVNELKTLTLPELDDEFAKLFGHDTFAQLDKAISENLVEEKVAEQRKEKEEKVLEALCDLTKFELPASLVQQELDRLFEEARERLQKMQFEWNTYLEQTGKTGEELKEEMRPQAEKNVRIGLALGKVIDEEGLSKEKEAGRLAVEKLVEYATK